MDQDLIMQLVLVVVLTLINAFFAASEMAIVSANRNKINKLANEGNKKAIQVAKLMDEPTNFLSTIQIAITLSGFFNSASAATGISNLLASSLEAWKIPNAQGIAMVIITLVISFVTLIFGELVPKRLALQKPEAFAMFSSSIIRIISKVASPIVKLLSLVTRLVLMLFKVKDENVEESLSREDIKMMLADSKKQGVLDEDEIDMLDGVLDFDDIIALEIMTPRTQVFAIDVNDDPKSYIETMMELYYSRIPVYEDQVDQVIGILYLKDFFKEAYHVGFEHVDIRKILRKPYFVPATKKVDELFKEMQKLQQHIAILVDEYGGFTGILTIEDLIEEVMGDIEDEYDDPLSLIKYVKENLYEANGALSIEVLNEVLSLKIENEHYDTLQGFLMDELAIVLEDEQQASLEYENYRFTIEIVKNHRIEKVMIERIKEE